MSIGTTFRWLPPTRSIWARLTGLARLPRSRLTPISSVRIPMCSYEKAGYRDLGNRDENFPIWTLQPGQSFPDKLASLSQQGGQNGIILSNMYFHFRSIRINFLSKVTRVNKVTKVTNDTSLCWAILVLFLEFHPGWPCWRQNTSQPGYWAHMKRL